MQSLAQFASAAYKTASLIEDLKRNSEELENSQAELRKRVADVQTTTEALKLANVDLKHFRSADIKCTLSKLMQNLIGNSIKYRSDQPSRIHATAEPAADEWHFIVTDNGVGIEPKYREQIFNPLERLHGFEIPGTGLGLAICRRIVERCGGKIWVESEPGKGASFHFMLLGEDCAT